MSERLRYLTRRVHCLLRGHDWATYASPMVTIRECDRCAATRWSP